MPTAQAPQQVTGLILAGGLGRRMGGVDKGLQTLNGKPLVAHAIARLAPQVDSLLINANRNANAYAKLGYPVIADRISGFAGPLAGIHAGLVACTTPLLASVPCDSPHLPHDLINRLRDALLLADAQIAIARSPGGLQPAFALMKREVLPNLAAFLDQGRHKMRAWCSELSHCIVDFADDQAFANINTLDELSASSRPA